MDFDMWVQSQSRHDLPGPSTCLGLDRRVEEEADTPVKKEGMLGQEVETSDRSVHEVAGIVFGNPTFCLEPLEV